MKVKMLVSMAGPDECWKPGDTREVSEAIGLEWEAANIATVLPDAGIIVLDGDVAVNPPPQKAKAASKAKKVK